jgi:endonuclease YncB( thermonuclease family)
MRTRLRSGFAHLLAIALLGALVPTMSARSAPAADIDGNTYTSPTFGYTVTWDDAWFVVGEEISDGIDYLALTNATTFANVLGVPDGSSATACLGSLVFSLGEFGLENPEPLLDDDGAVVRGTDGLRAFAAFSGTVTVADATTVEVAAYLDCQPVVPGASVLALLASMPLETFDGQLPLVRDLLAGVALPGAAPIPGPAVDAPDEPGPGEPAPVFATGRWRVAVAATVRDAEIAAAELEAKSGREWIVVVADVTNWTNDQATFAAEDLALVFAGDDRRHEVAPNSSRAVARTLEPAVNDLDAPISIDAGETVRLALVYQVPADAEGPTLQGSANEPGLPLDDGQEAEALREVREPVAPPTLQAVEVVAAVDGEVLEIRIDGEEDVVRARLIGVNAPAKAGCYAEEATAQLDALVAEPVWIERDPTERGGTTEKVYLWTEDSDGTRVLVNQQQVALGYAETRELDEEARFAAWLGESGRTAQADEVGLWGECEPAGPAATSEGATEAFRDEAQTPATLSEKSWPGVPFRLCRLAWTRFPPGGSDQTVRTVIDGRRRNPGSNVDGPLDGSLLRPLGWIFLGNPGAGGDSTCA